MPALEHVRELVHEHDPVVPRRLAHDVVQLLVRGRDAVVQSSDERAGLLAAEAAGFVDVELAEEALEEEDVVLRQALEPRRGGVLRGRPGRGRVLVVVALLNDSAGDAPVQRVWAERCPRPVLSSSK
jgi:hypothetical protein